MDANAGSSEYVLPLAAPRATLETVGGKGASLARLVTAGLPVPNGFHITTTAYQRFVVENDLQPAIMAKLEPVDANLPDTLEAASKVIQALFLRAHTPPDVAGAISQAYAELAGQNPVVAVRSSATAEDLPEASFAGQQETYLNIQGIADVLDATKRCWASLWTARAIGYRARQSIEPSGLSLAVVVQTLVPAESAGILFTANPVSGSRDQSMISAAWGLGEAVVGGLVTPDTLIVDKISGTVLDRQTTDKEVMTVRANSGTLEQPVPDELRRAPVLDDSTAAELVRLGVQIEELFSVPMDIEWALADGHIFIVQARPITALPEPEAPQTIDWKPPRPKSQYMRGSIVDLLPDPVSPLFATLAIPTISQIGVKEVLRPLTRSEPVLPDDYITTINEYAYMGIGYTPRMWWWVVTRMLPAIPRMMRMGIPFWRDKIRPRYLQTIARWEDQSLDTMPVAELWSGIQEVNEAAMLHLASLLVATTGASAGAEGLFTQVYEKMIRRKDDPEAVTYLMGFDSTPIQAEKALYDLAIWVGQDDELAAHLLKTPTEQLTAQVAADSAPVAGWSDFCACLQEHQKTYGHIIYDLDFAKPLPLDDPAPKIEAIKMYLHNQGTNPHERQNTAEEIRQQTIEATLQRLKGLRRWAFRKTLDMAQTMAEVRENALSDIGLGYPLLRKMLHELGRRCAEVGWIGRSEDIFWLTVDEVQEAVESLERGGAAKNLSGRVVHRKATHQTLKQFTPPPMLPAKKKFMGINMAAFTPATEDSHVGNTIKGVGASVGRVTAIACVLHSPEDFNQMKPGEVLVAATTTPAWTPLFAMASAVVTDIGGPLSHGSIVAREYGIPAVLGTGVATRRIHSGQTIIVDGNAGSVTILNGE
ncbi:MAG: phosphoenolpyruvate synthase [Anaerolineae bacterium]|nr:phosphoenolpyruvate synthase [Anaerolineae bacterium]